MNTHFNNEFFQNNRERLRTLFTGTAPIILSANGLLQRSTDTAYNFVQDGSFWYLTGIDEPNVILVLDKNKEYLILPLSSNVRDVFDGETDIQQISKTSGIETIYDNKSGWQQLSARLKKVKHVATLSPPASFIPTYGMYTNPARQNLLNAIKLQNSLIELLDLTPHIQKLRMLKNDLEIEAVKHAIQITNNSLLEVKKNYNQQKYSSEHELDADLYKFFRNAGSNGHAFDPIVASGKHGATLHYNKNNGQIDYGLGIVVDVGAEYNHYAADITRTWANEPSKRLSLVHAAVKEVHNYALDLLKPGVLLRDNESKIEHFMGEKLRELGLIKVIDSETVRRYFPHSTSHFLGIDVHDVGDYKRPLEPGVILTIEPGIYIPEENIGVRIEDDVLITAQGYTNLSDSLPHDLS